MMSIVNKSTTHDILSDGSKRNRIGKNVVPYIDTICKRLVHSIIDIDNSMLTPDDDKTLTKQDIDESLKILEESYGIAGLSDAIDNIEKKQLIVGETPGQRQSLDINLNITVKQRDE